MTTTKRRWRRLKTIEDFHAIPGYTATLDTYVATLKMCLTDITLSMEEAAWNRGVPPVRSVMDRYEGKLSALYDELERLAEKYDA